MTRPLPALQAFRACGLCAALIVVASLSVQSVGGCNNVGNCPAPETITPGASCSGDSLECPYTLQSAAPACDGTAIDGGVPTSCVCTGGSWSCPQAVACPLVGDGGSDDSASEAASNPPETGSDETVEPSGEGSVESGADGASEASGGDSGRE